MIGERRRYEAGVACDMMTLLSPDPTGHCWTTDRPAGTINVLTTTTFDALVAASTMQARHTRPHEAAWT